MYGGFGVHPEIEDLHGDELVDDTGSSVSGFSQAHIDDTIDRQFENYEGGLNPRFDSFAFNFMEMIRGEIIDLFESRLSNHSFSAPQEVPFCQAPETDIQDPLKLNPPPRRRLPRGRNVGEGSS